jgi:hypothetical protein
MWNMGTSTAVPQFTSASARKQRRSSTKSKATIGKGVLKTSILVLFVDVPVPDPVIVVVL